jgi:hypothetical protein
MLNILAMKSTAKVNEGEIMTDVAVIKELQGRSNTNS